MRELQTPGSMIRTNTVEILLAHLCMWSMHEQRKLPLAAYAEAIETFLSNSEWILSALLTDCQQSPYTGTATDRTIQTSTRQQLRICFFHIFLLLS